MMGAKSAPDRSAFAWLAQAVSGAMLLGLLTLHMIANHFVVEDGLRGYADVLEYLSHPAVLPFELLFLVTVTVHAALGVRAVIFDFGVSPPAQSRWNRILLAVGTAIVAYGLLLTWTIVSRAADFLP